MPKTDSNVATMHDKGDPKRRELALTSITHQLEAIFAALLFFVRYERGEVPEWHDFDSECLPDVARALAIRGAALNIAMMNAIVNQISTEDLESLVFVGL